MARCEECLHFEVCEALEQFNGLMKVPPIHCGFYKPTADVAPKSEVDWHREAELNAQRIIELEAEKDALIKNYAECMKNYAREFFEDIYEDCFEQYGYIDNEAIAELKKKYTGDSDES